MTDQSGSMLIGMVILSLLVIALITYSSKWSSRVVKIGVDQVGTQRANQYADSCINMTTIWLKSPKLKQTLPSGTTTLSMGLPNGRCDVDLYRINADHSLVETYATGYYFAANSGMTDPKTGAMANQSSIHGVFRIANAGEYLTAVPGTLHIAYGATAATGMLYGNNIVFDPPLGAGGSPATIGDASYFSSVSYSTPAVSVNFTNGLPAQLPFSPNFATLDMSMRSQYQPLAAANNPTFTGTVIAPSKFVYYVDGDVDIAQGSPLVVQGVYVIYVTGTVTIHNHIQLADANSWIGILAEGEIDIAADAPDTLSLAGNYISNGLFAAKGSARAASSSITINGGIVTLAQLSLASVYTTRNYQYATTNSPNLLLPNIAQLLQFSHTTGASLH